MKTRNLLILTSITVFIALTFSYAYSVPKFITIQLTNNDYDDRSPQINCNGDDVWAGFVGIDYEIFLYKRLGETTVPLTNNDYSDGSPQINCDGDVVWIGGEWFNRNVFLYERSS